MSEAPTEWWQKLFPAMQNLFMKNCVELCQAECTDTTFTVDNVPLSPFICSDFFFGRDFSRTSSTILLMMNESWFVTDDIKRLMVCYVKFKALEFNKEIICAHDDGVKIF